MSEEIENIVGKKRKSLSLSSPSSTTTTATTTATTTTTKSSKKIQPILSLIIDIIRKNKSPTGTSLQKIVKESVSSNEFSEKQIKNALKKYTSDGTLVQNKSSYLVNGETYQDTSSKVQIEDLILGTGDEVAGNGDTCTISYIGTLENKACFDKSSNFKFTIGGGDVIKGFDISVTGMKRGGKRKCVIPPELGYGKRGSLPEIPPSSTLIFEVTLKDF